MKLNQLIAIAAGQKAKSANALKNAKAILGNASLFEGHTKIYHPYDDEGDALPEDTKKIQTSWADVLADLFAELGETGNVVAGIDQANQTATATITVGATEIAADVPATQLIFLEKQLVEVRKIIAAVPTLDPSVNWTFDESQGYYVSDPVRSIRTQKVPTRFVRSEATERHPAQVDVVAVDKGVGDWITTRISSAMPVPVKRKMLAKIDKTIESIVQAREKANMEEATTRDLLGTVLDFVRE